MRTVKILFQIAALLLPLILLTSCSSNIIESEKAMTSKIPGIVVPSAAEIRELSTANYDMHAVKAKNLAEDGTALSQEYIYLQAIYRAGFNRWLDGSGLLTSFDAKLQSDSRGFIVLSAEGQEYNQKYASFGREYLYIINSFFIERLSEEDLHTLKTVSAIDDAALAELVARTHRDIIEVREQNGQPCYSVVYKTTVSGIWEAPADAIVLEIRYRWNYHSIEDSTVADVESGKEKDVVSWRDELVESLYKQTDDKVFAFIDNH